MSFLDPIARRPRLAAVLGALCIAFSGILYRFTGASPETASFWRSIYGLPILGLVALLEWRAFGGLPRRTVAIAAVAGVLFAIDLTFWHHAIEWVGAGLATVLANLQVVIVALVAWALLGERPSHRALVAIPVVLAGAVLISGVLGGGAYGRDPALGVVLGIVSAVAYAGYLLVIRRGGRDIRRTAGPIAISTMATAVSVLVAGGALGTISLAPSWPEHGWLLLYGVTAQSAGYLFISLSLPRLPAAVTSIILLMQPVGTVVLARIFLAESPSAVQLLGVILVVGGVAFATVPFARLRARVSQPAA